MNKFPLQSHNAQVRVKPSITKHPAITLSITIYF